MFRDSKIAELFSCGNTKCSYIINFDIGPYFQSLLNQALKEALVLCVYLMNHMKVQLKRERWT